MGVHQWGPCRCKQEIRDGMFRVETYTQGECTHAESGHQCMSEIQVLIFGAKRIE